MKKEVCHDKQYAEIQKRIDERRIELGIVLDTHNFQK